MDEPTNHLDLPAREALETALKNFSGTLVFVSHDRYFISALAESIAEIEGGKLNYYDCGYGEFTESKKSAEPAEQPEKKERSGGYRSRKERAEEEKQKQLRA